MNFFTANPTSPRYETTEMEKIGYNTLHDLDLQGLLGDFVYNGNWSNLKAALGVALPSDVYFNLTVFDINQNNINDERISRGYPTIFETSKTVSSINYAIIGYTSPSYPSYEYDPRIINLQLVRG